MPNFVTNTVMGTRCSFYSRLLMLTLAFAFVAAGDEFSSLSLRGRRRTSTDVPKLRVTVYVEDDSELNSCASDLIFTDTDNDNQLSKEEFADFIEMRSNGKISSSFATLRTIFVMIYYTVACTNCYRETMDESCCVGKSTYIPLTQDNSTDETILLSYLCTSVDTAITDIFPVEPTSAPTEGPTLQPLPSSLPSSYPSSSPSSYPSGSPSSPPTVFSSSFPSQSPSSTPSLAPTEGPSASPSETTSGSPSYTPSASPSGFPSVYPSTSPSAFPSFVPSVSPSTSPSVIPSSSLSGSPSTSPSVVPSSFPSGSPSTSPSVISSSFPSGSPSTSPSDVPTMPSSRLPSSAPSDAEIEVVPTALPSNEPSSAPTESLTTQPSIMPSSTPTTPPSHMPSLTLSQTPSSPPTDTPSGMPSMLPSSTPIEMPSTSPSSTPSGMPSTSPSSTPIEMPSTSPSSTPIEMPSTSPSNNPSEMPATLPSSTPIEMPSRSPSNYPSEMPSSTPSNSPSSEPSDSPSIGFQEPRTTCVSFGYNLENQANLTASDIFDGVGNQIKIGLLAATRNTTILILNQTFVARTTTATSHEERRTRRHLLEGAPRAFQLAILDEFGSEILHDIETSYELNEWNIGGSSDGRFLSIAIPSDRRRRRLVFYSDDYPPEIVQILDNPYCPQGDEDGITLCAIIETKVCVVLEEGDNPNQVRSRLLSGFRNAINSGVFWDQFPPEFLLY